MRKNIIIPILIIGILLSGCNSNQNNEEPLMDQNSSLQKDFLFEDIIVRRINGTQGKYEIDNFQEDDENSFDDLLDSLPSVGTVKLDYSNEKTPLKLMKGSFYNININFTTNKKYSSALGFNLVIQNIDNTEYSSISIDEIIIDDINESGEYAVNVETIIPDDISLTAGNYILLIDIRGEDVNRSNEQLDSMEDLKTIQYIGGFYLKLEEKDISKTIDIVDIFGDEYIDLPIDMTFKNEVTNDFIGKSTLIIYSTVSGKTPLIVRGVIEVDGAKYPLKLLDTNDGIIKDEVVVQIPTFDGNNIEGGDRDLSYFLDKTSYDAILEKAPDLSKVLDSDGIEGKIVWYVDTNNSDIETNDIEESLLISKYVKNLSLEDDFNVEAPKLASANTRTTRAFNPLTLVTSEYTISDRSLVSYLEQDVSTEDWDNTSKIKNFKFGAIEASLDYDKTYVYLFSGNQFVKYNKKTKEIDGSPIKLKDKWPNTEFDSIDAAFRWDDKIYFFSGHKYARGIVNGSQFYTKDNISSYWDTTLGNFAPFDAAFRGTSHVGTEYVFFLKGDKYIAYDFAKDKSTSPITISTWAHSGYENNEGFISGLSAISPIGDIRNPQKILFKDEKSSSSALINEGILFKYDAGFKKNFGNKKKFAVTFSSNNEIQAKWSLPSINAESKSNIYIDIYNKIKLNLLELDIQAGIGIRKTHPNYKTDDDGVRKKAKTRRYGAKATLSILGLSIAESGNMEEELIEEELDPKDAKEELKEAEEEGEKKKRSLKIPTYEWEEEKVLFTHNFFTETSLPLKAEFGISGSFKIEPDFDIVGAGIELKLETPMAISAFIRGSLSIELAEAGVEAKLNIIQTGGEASVGAGLKINEDNELQIVGEGNVKFYLRLVNGEFNIYGKVFRPTPWDFGWKKKTWNIYTTPWLYNREWMLLEYKKGITILDLKEVF
ncbi:MAG: hemopexin repeat-containing protein [Sulfurovum sp.]|nr:hemopexin repeat-containing protein [Sulfurovum sp.]